MWLSLLIWIWSRLNVQSSLKIWKTFSVKSAITYWETLYNAQVVKLSCAGTVQQKIKVKTSVNTRMQRMAHHLSYLLIPFLWGIYILWNSDASIRYHQIIIHRKCLRRTPNVIVNRCPTKKLLTIWQNVNLNAFDALSIAIIISWTQSKAVSQLFHLYKVSEAPS